MIKSYNDMEGEEGHKGRVMAVDLGSKTIGLALSDPKRIISQSLCTLKRKGLQEDVERVARLAEEHGAAEVVVGLPLHLSGKESEGSARARGFARGLEAELGLPVHLLDESLTTREAEAVMLKADLSRRKRKRAKDGLAAALILRRFLDQEAEEAGGG